MENNSSNQHDIMAQVLFSSISFIFVLFVIGTALYFNISDVGIQTAYATGGPTPTPTPTFTPTPTPCSSPDIIHNMSISRNSVVSLSETYIDEELTKGFQKLREDFDGIDSYDVSCCFKLARTGSINVITSESLRDIASVSELNTLRSYGYDINYVQSISYDGGAAGLAILGEEGFAIASGYGDSIIYHEYGHTVGLQHLTEEEYFGNLMYEDMAGWYTMESQCNILGGNE